MEHLAKFEELLEAAVDLDRIPDEYLICASYDADLQVCFLQTFCSAGRSSCKCYNPLKDAVWDLHLARYAAESTHAIII